MKRESVRTQDQLPQLDGGGPGISDSSSEEEYANTTSMSTSVADQPVTFELDEEKDGKVFCKGVFENSLEY